MRATMKQNRAERKAMADSRAMEEQMERHNPISGTGATPSMGLSQVRGGAKMMKNAAAQGKMLMEHLGSLHGGAYAKQFHEGMKGSGFFGDLGIPIVSDVAGMFGLGHCKNETMSGGLHTGRYEGEGMGTRFSKDDQDFSSHMKGGFMGLAMMALPLISKLLGAGKMSQGAHDMMKKMIEDHEKKHHSGDMKGGFMGLAMMALPLISKLLGAGEMTKGAHDQLKKMFKKGAMDGKGAVSDIGHKLSDMLPGPYGKFGHSVSKLAGLFGLGSGQMEGCGSMDRSVGGAKMTAAEKKAMKSILEKHEMDGGRRDPVPYGRPQRPVMELMDGGLKISDLGHNLSNVAEAFGPNRVGKVGHSLSNIAGMFGLGKQKRVVGAGDGRRKRAEIVRKVMADKGMKMIEASKYVKEHGLYKP